MAAFVNHSIFPALAYQALDQHNTAFHVVVARMTYDINIKAQQNQALLTLSAKQAALNFCDQHYKDPLRSSIEFESDLAPYKPDTDIIINATAFAPGGKATSSFDVGVKVAGKLNILRVHGPRFWKVGPFGWVPEQAMPVDRLDLRYEYASGGWYDIDDKTFASPYNPTGMGWYPAEYLERCGKMKLPAPQNRSRRCTS